MMWTNEQAHESFRAWCRHKNRVAELQRDPNRSGELECELVAMRSVVDLERREWDAYIAQGGKWPRLLEVARSFKEAFYICKAVGYPIKVDGYETILRSDDDLVRMANKGFWDKIMGGTPPVVPTPPVVTPTAPEQIPTQQAMQRAVGVMGRAKSFW